MRNPGVTIARKLILNAIFVSGLAWTAGLAGCGSSKPAEQPAEQAAQGPQRYHLEGRVVSVEPAKQQVVVDHGDIPGFMAAMQMGYSVKDPSLLKPLTPEDQIKADVVVNGNDVYLENIVVTKKADQSKVPASSQPAKQ